MPEKTDADKSLVIVGDEDIVAGFKALGFKVYGVKKQEEIDRTFSEIIDKKIAVCLIQDNIYQSIVERLSNYVKLPLPVFIPFAKDGRFTILDEELRKMRLRAIGKD